MQADRNDGHGDSECDRTPPRGYAEQIADED
jgi:hypothetical protein